MTSLSASLTTTMNSTVNSALSSQMPSPASDTTSSPTPLFSQAKRMSTGTIAMTIALPVVFLFSLTAFCIWLTRRRRRQRDLVYAAAGWTRRADGTYERTGDPTGAAATGPPPTFWDLKAAESGKGIELKNLVPVSASVGASPPPSYTPAARTTKDENAQLNLNVVILPPQPSTNPSGHSTVSLANTDDRVRQEFAIGTFQQSVKENK